jgi:L-rhamnonate dehydratase
VKIKSIRAFPFRRPAPDVSGKCRAGWQDDAEVANPMSRYPRYKARRAYWRPALDAIGCLVTAEDGSWGFGTGRMGAPAISIINDHLGKLLEGEPCLATERLWDMMYRLASPYSAAGMASYAISAIDLALWDLKGRVLGRPVYELLGGPARDRIECYATGNDTDWYMELGFRATKLACPYGPADGLDGLAGNERLVAKARELIGDEIDLMLDCWMAFDVEFAVRLAERLRPYRLKWIEDCLIPEDFDGFAEMRRRLPWISLATGEHWYAVLPFFHAAKHALVDIFQPDIEWVGGVTACAKICHIAEASGRSVMLHAGMNTLYGQHLTYAMPSATWGEYFVHAPPAVPLAQMTVIPGTPVPERGAVNPPDAPGFGMDIDLKWIEASAG